jgi:hypothetical protein
MVDLGFWLELFGLNGFMVIVNSANANSFAYHECILDLLKENHQMP